MSNTVRALGLAACVAVACFAIAALSYRLYAYFAPRYTATDYTVYKQSQQYNDGMAIELERYSEAYTAPGATADQKANIRSTVLHDFASYDERRLSPDLRDFLDQMKGQSQ